VLAGTRARTRRGKNDWREAERRVENTTRHLYLSVKMYEIYYPFRFGGGRSRRAKSDDGYYDGSGSTAVGRATGNREMFHGIAYSEYIYTRVYRLMRC